MSVETKTVDRIDGQQLMKIFWEAVNCGNTGDPQEIGSWVKSAYVQVTGDPNSQTLTMQGSIDGTTYFSLTKADGSTAMTFAAAGGLPVVQLPRYIRPSLGGSSGGDVDVTLLLRG